MPPKRKLSVMLEIETDVELKYLRNAGHWSNLLYHGEADIKVTQASAHVIQKIEDDEDEWS